MSEGSLSDMDIKIATSSLSMHKTFRVRLKFLITFPRILGFPGVSVVKNLPANAGDTEDAGSTPGLGRSPGIGNGNPLEYSCLENPMERGAWWATVHVVTKSQT